MPHMNKQITVSLPLNVTKDELGLFEPYLTYELTIQKVKKFKNAFVSYSGLSINKKGLIKETHHDHPHQIQDYIRDAVHYYNDVIEHPTNLITLDNDNVYLLIHHPWFNYYHWICESIFRAWMVRHRKDEMILLLPDFYSNADFIMGSIEPFCFKNIFFIPKGKSLLIKNLCVPQLKPRVDSYNYKMIDQVKNFYLKYVSEVKKIFIDLGERIYLSRKKANRKKIYNEKEIEPLLTRYNFKIINNEDYSFIEQVAIYSNAKFLISMHGSGLTNMLFMTNGSSILEFHKRKTNDKDWHSKAFWYLAEALGHNYYQQLCEPTNIDDDYFKADFIVDVCLLEKNLALMFPLEL